MLEPVRMNALQGAITGSSKGIATLAPCELQQELLMTEVLRPIYGSASGKLKALASFSSVDYIEAL